MAEISTILAHRNGVIQPIAKPGENLGIWIAAAHHWFRVVRLEPWLPSNAGIQNFGAVNAGAALNPVQATTLEFDTNRVAQLRCAVLDDIRVRVFQPQAVGKFVNVDAHTEVSLTVAQLDPDASLTEFFVFEDKQPFFRIENPTAFNLAQTRVMFWGLQYLLEPVSEMDAKAPSFRAAKLLATGLAG